MTGKKLAYYRVKYGPVSLRVLPLKCLTWFVIMGRILNRTTWFSAF